MRARLADEGWPEGETPGRRRAQWRGLAVLVTMLLGATITSGWLVAPGAAACATIIMR